MDFIIVPLLMFSLQQGISNASQGSAMLTDLTRERSNVNDGLVDGCASASELCALARLAAEQNSLPATFFLRLIWQESRFHAGAIGPLTRTGKRAQGIAQFMPPTAAERGLSDPFDPAAALPKSAEFLRDLRHE